MRCGDSCPCETICCLDVCLCLCCLECIGSAVLTWRLSQGFDLFWSGDSVLELMRGVSIGATFSGTQDYISVYKQYFGNINSYISAISGGRLHTAACHILPFKLDCAAALQLGHFADRQCLLFLTRRLHGKPAVAHPVWRGDAGGVPSSQPCSSLAHAMMHTARFAMQLHYCACHNLMPLKVCEN